MTQSASLPLPVSVTTARTSSLIPITSIRGAIDICTEDLVQDELSAQLMAGPPLLVLDLTGVGFIGAAGVHLVLRNHERALEQRTVLAVVADVGFVRRVLMISGIAEVLNLYWDVPSAVKAAG